jgi:hypothetical protein
MILGILAHSQFEPMPIAVPDDAVSTLELPAIICLNLPLALACNGRISGTYTQGMQFTEALGPELVIPSIAPYHRINSPKYQHVREQKRYTCRCCSMLQALAILRP